MKTKKLFMMCLLAVTMICACTVHVSALEYQESTTTIFDEGGDYSLYYILNHFNHFVKEDATAGHTIGPIAVGGKANYLAGNGTNQGYNHTTSSYLKGSIDTILPDGYFKKLYVGETNRDRSYNHQNEHNTFVSKNDCYIDFDKAFDEISAESKTYQGDIHITYDDLLAAKALPSWNGKVNSFDTNYWEMTNESSKVVLKLESGYSYKFDNDVLKNIARIDLMDSDSNNKDTLFIADDQGSITIPYIYLNGNYNEISGEWGESMSAVYVLPYASEVTPYDHVQKHIGHIVAPNAFVHGTGGDVNGCFIAKSIDLTGSESHMFPYYGQKIKNNGSPIQPSTPEPGENKPGEGTTPSTPEPGENKPEEGTTPSTPEPGESKPEEGTTPSTPKPGTSNPNEGTTPKSDASDLEEENKTRTSEQGENNSSTNNEIILNKEELKTTNTQNTPNNSSNKVIVETKKVNNDRKNKSVKTGDNTSIGMYLLLELFACIGMICFKRA